MLKTTYLVFVALIGFMGLQLYHQAWHPAGAIGLPVIWFAVVAWMLWHHGSAAFMMLMGVTTFITGVALAIYLHGIGAIPCEIAWLLFVIVVTTAISVYGPAWSRYVTRQQEKTTR